MTSALLTAAFAIAVVFHLAYLVQARRAKAARSHANLVASLSKVLSDLTDVPTGAAGVLAFTGAWRGRPVQVQTIVDTLATRKLPACWLSVSLIEKVAVPGIFDMMMRPASPTTFSNFDLLPHTLPSIRGFPAEAVVRTDQNGATFPNETISRRLDFFADPRVKELLITPNGVRIVRLFAEADRARYGVFRQAEFNDAVLDPDEVENMLRAASLLSDAINQEAREAA